MHGQNSKRPRRTREFDYSLPADRIAATPAPRGKSRLFVLDARGAERHRRVADLPALLRAGDLLVLNNTRVLDARLFARKVAGGGRVEILLTQKEGDRRWRALLRPARRLRSGSELLLADGGRVLVEERRGQGAWSVRFSAPIEDRLSDIGHVPLPPYLRRRELPQDREWYQTVYAKEPGAVAAPTAGLHFSQALLDELQAEGIRRAEITLHVGPGTFKPVACESIDDHELEAERFVVPPEACAAIEATRSRGGRIVAVGTTVVRALEAAARMGGGALRPGPAATDLFIRPGFRFAVVDVLLTNFHLPRSTLLMLVCAFAGHDRVLAAYAEAVAEGYRFYSYGDAMLAVASERAV